MILEISNSIQCTDEPEKQQLTLSQQAYMYDIIFKSIQSDKNSDKKGQTVHLIISFNSYFILIYFQAFNMIGSSNAVMTIIYLFTGVYLCLQLFLIY